MANQRISGHLLIAIPFPEPTAITARIRETYPDLQVTYITAKLDVNFRNTKSIDEETWKTVDYLCTLHELPTHPSHAPRLKFVHIIGAGADHLYSQPIYTEFDVGITTSSGLHATTIGEWVAMTSLAASRRLPELLDRQRAQRWAEDNGNKATYYSVADHAGQRMGILGYGSIGRQTARLAQALGMDVVAHTASPRNTPESRRDDGFIVKGTGDPDGSIPSAWFSGTDRASLHKFLSNDIDILVISVPLTPQTKGMLGREEFEILSKRNAFVVNVARGEVLDQEALVDALEAFESDKGALPNAATGNAGARSKPGLRGAALDVTTPEPLPQGHRLWTAPNCIITPHMSGVSRHYSTRALEILEMNLVRSAKGEKLVNLLNRKTGYASKV